MTRHLSPSPSQPTPRQCATKSSLYAKLIDTHVNTGTALRRVDKLKATDYAQAIQLIITALIASGATDGTSDGHGPSASTANDDPNATIINDATTPVKPSTVTMANATTQTTVDDAPNDAPLTLGHIRELISKAARPTQSTATVSSTPMPSQSTTTTTTTTKQFNQGLPVNRPAVILSSNDPSLKSYKDVLTQFRSGVNFTTKDFGPLKTKPLSNNKARIEFQTDAQRDAVLLELQAITSIKSESARRLRPLVVLKGVPNDVLKENVVDVLSRQNPGLPTSTGQIKFRFARQNKNPSLYNAVIEVSSAVRTAILGMPDSRVFINHSRVRVADHDQYTQCYRCLQFGHTKVRCEAVPVCSHCAESGHQYATCPNKSDDTKLKCHNCAKDDTNSSKPGYSAHSATSQFDCHRIRAVIKHVRSITDYGITTPSTATTAPKGRAPVRKPKSTTTTTSTGTANPGTGTANPGTDTANSETGTANSGTATTTAPNKPRAKQRGRSKSQATVRNQRIENSSV